MKKITSLCILLFLSMLIMSSCKKAEEKTLVKNITYDVLINSDNINALADESWWKCNIERSKRETFINLLFDMIGDSTINVTDENGKQLYLADVEQRMIIKDTVVMVRKKEPYDYYDTIITVVVKPEQINMIRFNETWTYDPETYQITKQIKSYGLSFSKRDLYGQHVYHREPFFWVKCNEEEVSTNPKKVLTERIAYSLPLYESHHPDIYHVVKLDADTNEIRDFLKSVWSAALNGTLKNMKEPDFKDLVFPELKKDSLVAQITHTYKKHNPSPDSVSIDKLCDFAGSEGKTLYFHERWIVDMTTMSIKKDVQVLTPGINVKQNGELKGSKYYFSLVYKNKMWQPL